MKRVKSVSTKTRKKKRTFEDVLKLWELLRPLQGDGKSVWCEHVLPTVKKKKIKKLDVKKKEIKETVNCHRVFPQLGSLNYFFNILQLKSGFTSAPLQVAHLVASFILLSLCSPTTATLLRLPSEAATCKESQSE